MEDESTPLIRNNNSVDMKHMIISLNHMKRYQ